MSALLQLCIIVLILINIRVLFASRLTTLIRLAALQGGVLAAVLLLMPHPQSELTHIMLLAGAVLCIKAVGFPWLLRRTLRKIAVAPADSITQSYLSHTISVMVGMAALLFSLWLETQLPRAQGIFPPFLLAAALMTLFTGLLLVIGHMKALTQVIGYLVAENGIFLLGIPLMVEGATWFELSLLLDVFVAVFVMGIAINHIHATFESINVGRFCSLRD